MCRSRLRATFLSNRDEVNADYKPSNTTETLIGYIVCCSQFLFFCIPIINTFFLFCDS